MNSNLCPCLPESLSFGHLAIRYPQLSDRPHSENYLGQWPKSSAKTCSETIIDSRRCFDDDYEHLSSCDSSYSLEGFFVREMKYCCLPRFFLVYSLCETVFDLWHSIANLSTVNY